MTASPHYLISACLCGENCRYDGAGFTIPHFKRLAESGAALPVCPEVLAGLPVPRPVCEILNGRVFNKDGQDRTEVFSRGAHLTLELAQKHGIRSVIFKERSPSCGCNTVFDGSFSGRLVPGQGIATALLRQHGIVVLSEEEALPFLA